MRVICLDGLIACFSMSDDRLTIGISPVWKPMTIALSDKYRNAFPHSSKNRHLAIKTIHYSGEPNSMFIVATIISLLIPVIALMLPIIGGYSGGLAIMLNNVLDFIPVIV